MRDQVRRMLVTGGTGKLGSRLVPALLERGIPVRLLTPDRPPSHPLLEWRQMDFMTDQSFASAMDDCDVVLHLAAELWDPNRMERVNGMATGALAAAAESAGIKVFCHISSVCVYGSPKCSIVTEETPVISPKHGETKDFFAPPYLQEYGRTKLLGEIAIRSVAQSVKYVILRPTNIFNLDDIRPILGWSFATRTWRGYRVTHHVYIDDVVAAILYLTERALNDNSAGGDVSTFIVSEDDNPRNEFRTIFDMIGQANGNTQYIWPRIFGRRLDSAKDVIKFKSVSARFPVGALRYSAGKLLTEGYSYSVGIAAAHLQAIRHASDFVSHSTPREDDEERPQDPIL